MRALFESGALNSTQARRKFLLLAQDRWDPERRSVDEETEGQESSAVQRSSGTEVSTSAQDTQGQGPSRVILQREKEIVEKGKGWIKIGCETFPLERQNMKWCSDVLDKLIAEANVSRSRSPFAADSRALHSSTDTCFYSSYDDSTHPTSMRCHWTCAQRKRGR